jgi:SAM-dependent methyltransferase
MANDIAAGRTAAGDLATDQPAAKEVEVERERDFWDHHIPSLKRAMREFDEGPDPNVEAMLKAVEPRPGRRILDVACGAGVTTAWLASMGASVVGVDLSPASIRRAQELFVHLGLDAELVVGDFGPSTFPDRQFDGLVGRYALHHLDIDAVAGPLAALVKDGSKAAFVETFGTNPVLKFARDHLVGRFGIRRLGTLDEHPLVQYDLDVLKNAFGKIDVSAPEFRFLRLFDRQVLRYRSPRMTKALGWMDDELHHRVLSAKWSFHQLVVLTKTSGD